MSYTELKTTKATFRLLHRFEGKKGFAKDLPKSFDAALVEMVHDPPVKNLDQRIKAYVDGLERNPDLALLVKKAKKIKSPLYFGDLAESKSLSSTRDLDLIVVEFLAGLIFLGKAMKSLLRGVSIFHLGGETSRKRKKTPLFKALGLLAFSLWLLSSVIDVLGIFLVKAVGNTAKKGPLRAIREAISEASHLHPEKTVVFLRNLIIAEKAWEVTAIEGKAVKTIRDRRVQRSRIEVKRKPLILLDFHFGHAGLLKMIKQKSQTRRTILRLYRPFIKDILRDPVRWDYLARLICVCWNGQAWQVKKNFLVDSLEEI